MRGRVLLAGSVLAAIVVTVLTTVVLLLVEPTLSKAEAIRPVLWPVAQSSRCTRCGSTTAVDAPRKLDTSWRARRPTTSASRARWAYWATRPIR